MKHLIVFCMLGGMLLSAAEIPVFKLDAVALKSGREVPGDPAHTHDHLGIRYLFANPVAMREFQRNPGAYEIQLGGACARMGPLSGRANPEIWKIHEDKLYIFGSQACLETFEADPSVTFDPDQEPPRVNVEARRMGKKLLEKAIEFMGGAARIDSVTSYTAKLTAEVDHNGERVTTGQAFQMVFPDAMRRVETWGERRFGSFASGKRGYMFYNEVVWPMHADQRRALGRRAATHLLTILRARTRADFIVAFQKKTTLAGRDLIELGIFFDGQNQTLGIDPQTGEILTHGFRGRGSRTLFGQVTRRFNAKLDPKLFHR